MALERRRMKLPTEKGSPKLDTPGTPKPLLSTRPESTSPLPACQVHEYQDHPFFQVQLLINETEMMVHRAERDKTTKAARTKFTTAGRFLNRTITLIPYFERQGRASLGEISSPLQRAATLLNHTDITKLPHAKQLAEDVGSVLAEALWKLSIVIKAEEDKLYPGCGRDEHSNIIWNGVTLLPGMKLERGLSR